MCSSSRNGSQCPGLVQEAGAFCFTEDDMTEVERMKIALAEMIYRNPMRHDGHAYEMQLAIWGMGLKETRPDPADFSQEPTDEYQAAQYAADLAAID